MTYFFKLYIYDKAEWSERGSHLRHHGLYSTLQLACLDLELDIRYDNRFNNSLKGHTFIVPDLPQGVKDEVEVFDRVHFFESENTIYDIFCFKLIH